MCNAAAARFYTLDRESQEAIGRGASPLRIARRKMRADIAVGQRAEKGIDQRMQPNVGVGMADEAAVMRDADAAEHHVIARPEGVHVDAGAGAHIAERGRLIAFARTKSLCAR